MHCDFGPGNGSPMATNVVVVVVVAGLLLLGFLLLSDFQSISQPIVIKFRLLIGGNIPDSRTVLDFKITLN